MNRIIASLICLTLMAATCRSADPEFPNIAKLTENGFISKIEITGQPENLTASVEEFYDVGKKVTKVNILSGGHRQTVILHNKFNQVASIHNNVCEVKPAQDSDAILNPMFQKWLYSATAEDSEVFYGPTSILRRANDDPPKYTGISTVRGMDCHVFTASDPDNEKVTANYYFTADWTTPINMSKSILLPVQIRLYGEGIPMEGSPDENYIQYVDYVYFVPALRDPRLYELPTGIGCAGLKSDQAAMPQNTKRFTMQGEMIETKSTSPDLSVNTFRVWFDYIGKMARLDVFSKISSVSKILDYNTGVMYVTRSDEECSALPISDSYFDDITGDLKLVMKDPNSAIGMIGEFYYLGKKFSRGIYCDVWESVVPKTKIDDLVVDRTVYTYYFTSHWWEVNVEGEIEEQVPVRLEINTYLTKGEESQVQTVFNFFQFRKHPSFYRRPFSIENCASGAPGKTYIAIDMETDDATIAEKRAAEFQVLAEEKILKIAGISPIRLPFVKVDFLPADISIMALILERAPALAQFVSLPDSEPGNKEISKGTFKTAELCAQACVSEEVCSGFHYCSPKGNCYISFLALDSDWGDSVKGVTGCDLYQRHEIASEATDVLLKEALDNLKTAVDNKQFTIEIEDKEGNETNTLTFKATEFESGVSPVAAGGHDKDMFTKVVERQKLNEIQTTRSGGIVLSAGECYRKCQKEENIVCSSFSYCIHNNECLLSSVLILPNKVPDSSGVSSNPMCTVYSIKYLQMFDEYKGQIRTSPSKDGTKVDSVEECAKRCREKEDPMCRGFDFCSTNCILYDKHVLDMEGKSDLAPVGHACSHYALKFSADFLEVGRFVMLDPNSVSASGDSVEKCSKLCAESTEFKCASFDFCASTDSDKSKCTLNTITLTDDGAKSEDSNKCNHYSKKNVIDDYVRPKTGGRVANPAPNTSGYTPGGLAGVIIGVLIFGIVVGALGFLIYSYFRKSRSMGGERSVKFMKQENA